MSATLTLDLSLDLLRPSILDPIEDAPEARAPLSERLRRELAPAKGDDRPATGDDLGAIERTSDTGGGLTLDDLVVGVWEGLSAHRTVGG